MVDLEQKNGNGESLEVAEAKRGIVAISALCASVNNGSFAPKWMDGLLAGLQYLGDLQKRLIAQIGTEEFEKMKAANAPQDPPRPN